MTSWPWEWRWLRCLTSTVNQLNINSHQTTQITQIVIISIWNNQTMLAHTTRTAGTVCISFTVTWQIKVDNRWQVRNIQTTRSHISRQQELCRALTEVFQWLGARWTWITTDQCRHCYVFVRQETSRHLQLLGRVKEHNRLEVLARCQLA